MYAIVQTGGKQFRAEKDAVLIVEKIDGEPGTKIDLDEVVMVNDGKVYSYSSNACQFIFPGLTMRIGSDVSTSMGSSPPLLLPPPPLYPPPLGR